MSAATFLSIVLIHLVAVMSPGPSFVLAIKTAVSEGFRTAVGLSIGFGIGAAIWAGAALAGLALLFEIIPSLFIIMKVVGGLFLAYLGYKMIRHAKEPVTLSDQQQAQRNFGQAVWFGLTSFLANPKPAVFFSAIFVGLVPQEATVAQRLLLLLVVFLVEGAWYIIVARLFSLQKARNAYLRLKAPLDRAFGTLIAFFGLKIALT